MIQPNIGPHWIWRIILMILAVGFLSFMYGLCELLKYVLI